MTLKFKSHTVSIAFISLVAFILLMINPGCKKHNIKWDLDRINQNDSVNFVLVPNGAPLVNTTNISSITQSSAIVSGEIISLGNSTITQHGHCWATSTYPTISDSKATLGSMSNLGTYSSSLNGLNNNTQFRIFDLTGKIVKDFGELKGDSKLKVSDLNAGVYILQMYTATTNRTHKIIVLD